MRAVWRRRGWRLLALMLVCTLPALFAWRVWPRERLLLQRAVRVADADDFDNWASDHEYLSVDLSDYIDAAHSPVITRWDLITGSTRSFIVKQCPHGTHTTILSSPDGRWALYWGLEGDIMAVNLQTGRRLSWPSPGDTYHFSNYWLADSRRWLQATTLPDYVTIYNLDMPTRSQRLSFPHAKTARWQEFMLDYSLTTRDHLLAVERKWAESYSDRLLIKGLTIREYRLLPQVVLLRSLHIAPPAGLKSLDMDISPAGDRIAWFCTEQRRPPLAAWLHRWFAFVPSKPTYRISLWVSRIDGAQAHEVGHIPVSRDYVDESNSLDLLWLPDGKKLSFIYKDALWTVPAD